MRLLRPIVTAALAIIAVMAGLFASVLVALTGAGVLLAQRLLRSRRISPSASAPTWLRPRNVDEPIDVVATEVPADRRPVGPDLK